MSVGLTGLFYVWPGYRELRIRPEGDVEELSQNANEIHGVSEQETLNRGSKREISIRLHDWVRSHTR